MTARLLWLVALLLLTLLPARAGIGLTVAVPGYSGPCDIVSCAEAYSVTRAMKASYTGNLFQLVRNSDSTTLNVGQVGHVVDMSGIAAFCAGTTCQYSILYGQINGNNMGDPANLGPNIPAVCTTSVTCLPPFQYDVETGLPILSTIYPTELFTGNASSTGVNGHTNPVSLVEYGTNHGYTTAGGYFGITHNWTDCTVSSCPFVGVTFESDFGYGNAGAGVGGNILPCATSGTFCAAVGLESPATVTNIADFGSSLIDMLYMGTFAGTACAVNAVNIYVNSATPIYTGAPYTCPSNPLNPGTAITIGGSGDGTHMYGVRREMLISNNNLVGSDFTNLQNNVNAFYAAYAPNACTSTGDMRYGFIPGISTYAGATNSDVSRTNTLIGYALRRTNASYFGPLADLVDNVGTSHTYGSVGCALDPAAATFCAANPPCHVSKLYFQGTYSSANLGNVRDTNLDLVQATGANRPTVDFVGLNGVPTLAFNGSQWMCTGTPGSNDAYFAAIAVVANHTSGSGVGPVISLNANTNYVGWSGANTATSTFTPSLTGGLTDNVWHSLVWEMLNTTSNTTTLYGDGNALVTGTTAAFVDVTTQHVCIGSDGAQTNKLTGEIAEVLVANNWAGGGTLTTATIAATVRAKLRAAWGGGI